jgi:putative ABC transport system substrate-binding protein
MFDGSQRTNGRMNMKQHIALLSWTVSLVLALGAVVTPARAQQPARIPKVGVLGTSATQSGTQVFRQALREFGYVEGENIIVEYRFTEGRGDRAPGLAAELVDLGPDITVALGATEALALKAATTTIPVVFAIVPDAVGLGLVDDNARPGGNLTGFTSNDPQQARKQLELLQEIIPGLTRVAILRQLDSPALPAREAEAQARLLGLEPQFLGFQQANLELEGAFEAARREHAEALLVTTSGAANLNRKAIAELAVAYRLPALFPPDYVDDEDWQGLVAYGTRLTDAIRRIPSYLDRILQGEEPGDLPVESVTRQALIINLDTARKIGVAIPAEMLGRADKVISSEGDQ